MISNYIKNFAGICIQGGASLSIMDAPEIRNSHFPSICNATVYNDNGRILTNLRSVNFIQCFERDVTKSQCFYGNLAYITRDDDNALRTVNYLGEINDNLETINVHSFNFIENDNPVYEMIGLEDVRLVRWNGELWGIGCNRDFDSSGYCNMVMVLIDEETGNEKRRVVIKNIHSYIEKNWVPIIDKPYHFMRWANPLEIYKVDIETGIPELVINKEQQINIDYDGHLLRGSSQVIPWKDYYITIIHVVELSASERGDKIGCYLHQFLVWDKEFNLVNYSPLFNFAKNDSEFCVGLCLKDNDFYIPFSTGDSTQYILKVNEDIVEKFINQEFIEYNVNHDLNIHEQSIMAQTFDIIYERAKYMYSIGYWAAAYFLFCKAYRLTNDVNQQYNIKCFEGLCLAKSDGRYICELYDFQYAASLLPDRPEAHYFISNYYYWRNYPALGVLNGKLSFMCIENLDNELSMDVNHDIIKFNYYRSLFWTPNFRQSKPNLIQLKNFIKNDNVKYLIDIELNRQINCEQQAIMLNNNFGK